MKNIKVVFMGTPEFAVPVLESLIDKTNVIGVVTQPDKEVGRHKVLTPSPIKELALKHSIKVLQPTRVRKEYNEIINLNPDIIVTCAYGQIIPKELLDAPRLGCINVHASLLPKLRGGAPLHRAIMEGYKKSGITIMYMDEHMDTGDIISQRELAIDDKMTTGELHDTLSQMGSALLIETLPSIIDGTNDRIKQNDDEVTYANLIKPLDEQIDFNKTSLEIYNMIRGLNPYPGAYTVYKGKRVKIYNARIGEKTKNKTPGKIIDVCDDGIIVSTIDGSIIITDIKIEGKKRMTVKEYLNGANIKELLKD